MLDGSRPDHSQRWSVLNYLPRQSVTISYRLLLGFVTATFSAPACLLACVESCCFLSQSLGLLLFILSLLYPWDLAVRSS